MSTNNAEEINKEADKEKKEQAEETTAEENNSEAKESKEEQSKEEELEQKYNEANEKYLRLYSEFENFRKRTAKERLEMLNTAGADTIKDLLPIMDDFERAIKSNEEATDIDSVKEGIQLVFNKFQNTLKQKGVKEINAVEQEFDTDLHEAVTKIPAPSKKLKGKVVDVVEKGYLLNDKVIRYAKVVVGE